MAALIGEPARAAMLTELLSGRALTATELATRAGVSAATASVHLARLVCGRLLSVEAQGRHRYFRLRDRSVARSLETLASLVPPPLVKEPLDDLRYARTCYDHLAGWLGVAVRDSLVKTRVLLPEGAEHRLTTKGEDRLRALGVDVDRAAGSRRSFARACLDWSERRPHLAGALGEALLARFLEKRWIVRRDGERAVDVTTAGRRALVRELGIELPR